MNVLDIVAQYLEEKGYTKGPAFNPGCFFFEKSPETGEKNRILLIRNDTKPISFIRTKEPTVIIIYRGWTDDVKSSLIDFAEPNSTDELDRFL